MAHNKYKQPLGTRAHSTAKVLRSMLPMPVCERPAPAQKASHVKTKPKDDMLAYFVQAVCT